MGESESGVSRVLGVIPKRAGWSSEINQLLIGEALSDEFDGKILNPYGVEIDLPFWVFKRHYPPHEDRGHQDRQAVAQRPGGYQVAARSIEATGLIHPIAVTRDGSLVAGFRRIEAFRLLGRDEIPHRMIDSLDDALKVLQAGRDENTERKPFTPSEALEPLEREAA